MGEFEKYVTAEEASDALRERGIEVAPKTLGERARTRRMPSHKVNGRRRYRISELVRYFEESSVHHEAAPRE